MIGVIEGLMLLSINENGKFSKNTYNLIRYGLAGAMVLELIQLKKVEVKSRKLFLTDDSYTGNEIIDDAVKKLAKPKKLVSWVYSNTLFIKKSRDKIMNAFVDKGIVREEEKRFLGIIPLKRYSLTNTYEKQELMSKIRSILLDDKASFDTKDIYLTSLIIASKAESIILSKEERKNIKAKLKLISKGIYFETEDKALKEVVDGIRYAIAANTANTVNIGTGIG